MHTVEGAISGGEVHKTSVKFVLEQLQYQNQVAMVEQL